MPLAPYACRPETSLGRAVPEPESALRSVYPARPRPDRALDPVPPARVQDAGVRQFRGRPFPHPADPLARGGADRPRAGPGAARRTRIWPRRWRWRTISATAPSAMPARRRWTRRWPASAASTTTCRPSASSPGWSGAMPDFDGLNLTFETLEGLVKHHGPAAPARRRRRWPSIRWRHGWRSTGSRRWRRRSRRSPTTSPTPTTISTTACARASSRSTSWRRCRWPARPWPRSTGCYPGLEPPRRVHETIRRLIDGMVRDLDRRRAAAAGELEPAARTTSGRWPAPIVALLARDRGGPARAARVLARRASIATTRSTACRSRRGGWCASWPRCLLAAPDCLPDGWRERAGAAAARPPPPRPYGTILPA